MQIHSMKNINVNREYEFFKDSLEIIVRYSSLKDKNLGFVNLGLALPVMRFLERAAELINERLYRDIFIVNTELIEQKGIVLNCSPSISESIKAKRIEIFNLNEENGLFEKTFKKFCNKEFSQTHLESFIQPFLKEIASQGKNGFCYIKPTDKSLMNNLRLKLNTETNTLYLDLWDHDLGYESFFYQITS